MPIKNPGGTHSRFKQYISCEGGCSDGCVESNLRSQVPSVIQEGTGAGGCSGRWRRCCSVLKAGLEAPSARNHQPWHFSVVQDAALIQEVHDEAAKVMEKNGSPRFSNPDFQMFYHAPTVIFLFGEKEFSWTQVDCGIAVENMVLAAESLGVGSVILGLPKAAFMGEKADTLRQKLQCPEGYDFVVALALGYAI